MNRTENPRNSGTHATRERCDRLAVLRPPTRPPPRRRLSSSCIVISWNERWKCKNVKFAVASRWRCDCYDRLPVLRPPTMPPPRRWMSSGCIVISWNERWKCKNVTFAVASRWRSDCESISQCRRVQGGTLIKREQFWSYQTTYTEVITVCSLVAKQRTSWLRPGHTL